MGRRKELLKALGLVGAGALAGSILSKVSEAYSIPVPEKIISPNVPLTPNIIIVNKNSYTIAYNDKGYEVMKSDEPSQVLQSSIDELSESGGGTILIKRGVYDGYNKQVSIVKRSNIAIIGEGIDVTILKRLPIIKKDSTETYNMVIANMTLDGANEVESVINTATYSKNFWLINLKMKNSKWIGLYWSHSSLKVIGCIFENLGVDGYDQSAGGNPYDDDFALFAFNKFIVTQNITGGHLTTGRTKTIYVIANHFYDLYSSKYAGVSFENNFGEITRVYVIANVFNYLGSSIKYNNVGVSESAGSGDAVYAENTHIGIGLAVKGFKRFIIKNNIFSKSPGRAIVVDSTIESYGEIIGNIVVDPSEVSNTSPNDKAIHVVDLVGLIKIIGNMVIDTRDTPKMVHGIVLGEARGLGVYTGIVKDNIILNGSGNAVSSISANVNILSRDNYSNMSESHQGKLYINRGVATITGDGVTTTFTVDIAHKLVSDKAVARITLDRSGSYKAYLVDADGDGFKETLRVVVTYDTAPASGETVSIYWEAEVIG